MLECVFELFTQQKRTPDRAEGGLGIGLALVKSLVELHGGTVSACSQGRGQGSTFTVTLPLTKAGEKFIQDAPRQPEQRTRQLNIMVVDDNVDAAHMLGEWLELEGHHVDIKTDAAQALTAACEHPAEVYLLDIGLPDVNGYELAQRLKKIPGNEQAAMVAITGYGQAQDVALSLKAGFKEHFVKPLDPTRLLEVLAGVSKDKDKASPSPQA